MADPSRRPPTGLDPVLLATPFAAQTCWHVVTGAPSCGKSTLIDRLAAGGFGTVPETARALMEEEVARGRTLDEIHADPVALQRSILRRQVAVERGLCHDERLLLDGAVPGSLAWYRRFGLDPNEALADCFHHRYATVFVLDRLPLERNGYRFGDEASDERLDEWITRDYGALGYAVVRVPVMPPDERAAFVLDRLVEPTGRRCVP